jgi:ribosomal protein S12 methylthiotransferase
LALERLRECAEIQDEITAQRRSALVGETMHVLVDAAGVGRSHREAPEIDGVIHVPTDLEPGRLLDMTATDAAGPDLWAEPVRAVVG